MYSIPGSAHLVARLYYAGSMEIPAPKSAGSERVNRLRTRCPSRRQCAYLVHLHGPLHPVLGGAERLVEPVWQSVSEILVKVCELEQSPEKDQNVTFESAGTKAVKRRCHLRQLLIQCWVAVSAVISDLFCKKALSLWIACKVR